MPPWLPSQNRLDPTTPRSVAKSSPFFFVLEWGLGPWRERLRTDGIDSGDRVQFLLDFDIADEITVVSGIRSAVP